MCVSPNREYQSHASGFCLRSVTTRVAIMELSSDAPVIEVLQELVAKFRANPNVEMEVRLGRHEGDRFTPGVTFAYSSALYTDMTNQESVKQWTGKSDLTHFTYKYFDGGIRGRYAVDKDAKTEFHQIKKADTLDVQCPTRLYALRFALKEEIPMRSFQTASPATLVRCNSRSSIFHHPWTYDFTKTVQGRTTEEACQVPHTIMVELELTRDETYLAGNTNEEIAIDFLGKARDLLGRYSESGVEEPLRVNVIAKR